MGRRASPRVLFGYFLHDAKSDNSFPFAGSSEVLQTSNQHIQTTNSHNPIKSFAASRLFPPPLAAIPSALRRCPCRVSTHHVLFLPFCDGKKPAESRLVYPTSPYFSVSASINFGKTDKMYKKQHFTLDRTVFLCYTIANKKRDAQIHLFS